MNYRDDMTDIMHTYGDASGRLSMTVIATAKAADANRSNMIMLITDGLEINDPVDQKQIAVPVSEAEVVATFNAVLHARQLETSGALTLD